MNLHASVTAQSTQSTLTYTLRATSRHHTHVLYATTIQHQRWTPLLTCCLKIVRFPPRTLESLRHIIGPHDIPHSLLLKRRSRNRYAHLQHACANMINTRMNSELPHIKQIYWGRHLSLQCTNLLQQIFTLNSSSRPGRFPLQKRLLRVPDRVLSQE